MNEQQDVAYAARLEIEYPERLNRLTTAFRLLWALPILVIGVLVDAGLAVPTVLMLLFRRRYPRWWFDFVLERTRFGTRVGVYLALMRDEYPSTEDEQAVHLELDYPDAPQLNRWLPLVKWLLALPHYIALAFLFIGAVLAVIVAWFAILVTGRYPRTLFNYLVGVQRWTLRLQAYMSFMLTDRYPPFSLR